MAADGGTGTRLINTAQVPIVSARQTLTVSSGQTSIRAEVLAGGTLDVLAGGTAVSATLLGTEVLPGGTDSLGFVSSGGTQTVSSGVVLGGTVGSGGVQTISSGGMALGVTVGSSGLQTISAGGVASGAVVYGSATILAGGIASGGFLSGTSFFVAATETILGGQAVNVAVGLGGELDVGFVPTYLNGYGSGAGSGVGGTASATTVNAGGAVYVGIGGVATGTVLAAGRTSIGLGATETVQGGVAYGTVVGSGATQSAYIGSTSGAVILNGGRQVLYSGTALNDTVSSGGTVNDDGTLAYTEAVGATNIFVGTLVGGGLAVQSGPGTLALAGNLSAFSGTVTVSGGTLELTSAGADGRSTIGFAPGGAGTLQIDGTTGPANTISGFLAGDIIDLAALAYAGTTTPTVSGNTVTVTEGGLTETLLMASAGNGLFRLFPDAAGGTDIGVACYCPGTLILTNRGERHVETLAIGDGVITLSGAAEPIRWIGRRSYAGRFLAGKRHLLPVRIRAGALGGGLPRRDLLVSRSHAMLLDGVLVPAGQLVDGLGVTQERGCAAVDYIHVELANHAVIFAEGAPSETYLDDDNRGMFHNVAEFTALYGDGEAPGRYCAPRVEDGYALEAVRRRLAERAA